MTNTGVPNAPNGVEPHTSYIDPPAWAFPLFIFYVNTGAI